MDPLANAWFILDSMNNLAMPLGLRLPFELRRTKVKHRKVTSLVLFVVVCMSLLCVRELYKKNNFSAIPAFIMASSTCCLILIRRYTKLENTSSVLETMLTFGYPQASLNTPRDIRSLLLKNWALLLKTTSLLLIVSLKMYLQATLHVVFRIILDLVLITECLLISCILDVVHKLIDLVEANTTHLYSEFYRCLPAEMKKADNGDFVLLGWMSQALAERRSGADVEQLRRNLSSLVGLADALDVFKETFSPAVSALVLVCVTDLVEIGACTKDFRHSIVEIASQFYLWRLIEMVTGTISTTWLMMLRPADKRCLQYIDMNVLRYFTPMPRSDTTFGYSYHLPSGGWTAKLRNALSQFSDIFSEFDKYIAPAYHHDRCERSVQMRLYTMHKREFVMVFLTFFACFGLGIFVGIAGPPITLNTEINGASLLPKNNNTNTNVARKDIATGPFVMRTPKMSTYSQQLWVIAKLSTENTDGEIIDKIFKVSVGISGLTEDHKPVKILDVRSNNRTRHLKCEKQSCDEFIVMHLGYLDYTHYIVTVNFHGLEAFHSRYNINELFLYFKTYNPEFTQIEIWFRFIFLLFTFTVTCWFQHSLRKYPSYDWSIEQKWMSILLPLMMAYDNPVFPMSFLVNSWIPGMVDAVAQATFLSGLLLFWLCIYHGLRQNDRHFLTFYLPKAFVVGMLWCPAIILSTWERINELQDPTYNHTVDTSNYEIVKAFFYIFVVVYLIYLCILILRAYTELRSMPFFGLRLKFLTLLMLVVLIISCVITVLRFGVGVLEDNFVAQLSTHYSNSSQFMSFYGLLNFYMYAMAYVYSPSGNANGHEIGVTKDNPAFSMINDSDEDVIYGSDAESRRPLNRPRNDDDSD